MMNELESRIEYLTSIIAMARSGLSVAPRGSLHVGKSHGRPRYGQRLPAPERERYLDKDDETLICGLAQKRYCKEVLKVAETCLRNTEKLARQAEKSGFEVKSPKGAGLAGGLMVDSSSSARGSVARGSGSSGGTRGPAVSTVDGCRPLYAGGTRVREVEDVYLGLPEEIRELVVPFVVSAQAFLEQWRDEIKTSRTFLTDECKFTTDQGEWVRSKSEVIIADRLYHTGVPYRYEPVITFQSGEVMRPDFLVLNMGTRQEILWEHFGMMDDELYRKKTWSKLSHYNVAGLVPGMGLITTFESAVTALDTQMIDGIIENFLL